MSRESKDKAGECSPNDDPAAAQIDEGGLRGLSALLTFSPYEPAFEFGERRRGRDRRNADRRFTETPASPE